MKRWALVTMLALAAVACGGGDDDSSEAEREAFDPRTATLNEKITRYRELARQRELLEVISRAEIPSVAANLCDNDLASMEFYVSTGEVLDGVDESAAQAATIADAFCPEARVQLEAAADIYNAKVPPPPH